jgi:hypothetical protein
MTLFRVLALRGTSGLRPPGGQTHPLPTGKFPVAMHDHSRVRALHRLRAFNLRTALWSVAELR